MKSRAPLLLLVAACLLIAITSGAEESTTMSSQKSCTSGEDWTFNEDILPEWQEQFKLFLSRKLLPVQSFAEAITMRKKSTSPESKLFADYWISRSIFQSDLLHISANGFTSIVTQKTTPHNAAIQAAALGCLVLIHERFPSFKITEKALVTLQDLSQMNSKGQFSPLLARAGLALIPHLLAEKQKLNLSVEQIGSVSKLLPQGFAESTLAQALVAVEQKKHDEVITLLQKYLADSSKGSRLSRFEDSAHQMLARSLYQKGRYDEAVKELKLIKPQSNNFAQALIEIEWNAIQKPNYPEAIGTGIGLQSGGMKSVFAPEAPVIMAMALNELCQFPEALKAINVFKKNYEPMSQWFKNWDKKTDLYRLAIAHYKGKSSTPTPIANEWLRNPLFLSRQDEINLLYKEKISMKNMSKSAASKQKEIAKELLDRTKKIKSKYQEYKKENPNETELPGGIAKELTILKEDIIHYNRLRNAAPLWAKVLNSYQERSKARQQELVLQINDDLRKTTSNMVASLNEASENAQLIEVEIFNGATNDLIWQNANPEYKKVAKQLNDDRPTRDPSSVWNWGDVSGGLEGTQEIWEDELNAFQANLPDNCSNKEKYLAIKKNVASSGH